MADDSHLWYLRKIDLFKDLSQTDLEYVSSCFTNTWYNSKDELPIHRFRDSVFLIKEGMIELSAISEDGKKVIVDLLAAGSIFGNIRSTDEFDFSAKVRRKSLVCHMSIDRFFKLVSKYPQVSAKLLTNLYHEVSRQQERISSLASETVTQRLLRLIKMQYRPDQSQPIKFTHEELAQMIGTSRQTITSILNKLQKDGLLEKKKGIYQIVSAN